jgi:hypothetical protein
MVEIGLAAGYLIAWAMRKARRVAGRLDAEADGMLDAGLDHLHEVVANKLGSHPVLAELVEEADAVGDASEVSDLTRERLVLELTAAARKDDAFGQTLRELTAQLRETGQTGGAVIASGERAAVFTGDAHAKAKDGGIAFAQVAGDVRVHQERPDPLAPGRSCR